ncbi:MAG TPA: ABC transporter permease [Streptosporangiaceae bacterium]|jgi:peptide/nickel transport system permease protein|nr:ABC transporter permease [Streptosporangiaceae bacterium]
MTAASLEASPPAGEPPAGRPGTALTQRPSTLRRVALRVGARLGKAAVTLVGVAIVVFIVLRLLPGNQITASLGVNAGLLSKAQYADLTRLYGIGKPVPEQFIQWVWSLARGDLGVSVQSGRSVTSLIGSALPVTLELAIVAMIIGLVLGVGAGALAAAAPGHAADRGSGLLALAGLGVPSFVIGAGLTATLAHVFHYFPSSEGFASIASNPWLNIQQIFWPALTLGLGIGAAILRTTRGAMLDVARQGYVRAARGRGLANRAVMVRHVLRNALIPILTMSGIQFGYLLGGTVIVEQIFVLPGLGRLLLSSVNERDYAVAQAATLVFAAGFVLVNLITDLLYAVADPRVRS